ncbi:uncharacterized protein KGF55_001952 [Candida pseudojiufengensis]|uniref:uncharacterized protein n=1 Tax=Candida pseudojiufengensis TaxID=497109 RepID=UPI002224608C|nr:uncharacterized protein KGF55_001952 [Candida pseudojiufengensis]KAI5964881.1 hypothetical protein KGF55_001952 [Candida pseudojiufengensis]
MSRRLRRFKNKLNSLFNKKHHFKNYHKQSGHHFFNSKHQNDYFKSSETDPNEMNGFLKDKSLIQFHESSENQSFFVQNKENKQLEPHWEELINHDLTIDKICNIIDEEIKEIDKRSSKRMKRNSKFKENVPPDHGKFDDSFKKKFEKETGLSFLNKLPNENSYFSKFNDIIISNQERNSIETITKKLKLEHKKTRKHRTISDNTFTPIEFGDHWEQFYIINDYPSTPQRYSFYERSYGNVKLLNTLERAKTCNYDQIRIN